MNIDQGCRHREPLLAIGAVTLVAASTPVAKALLGLTDQQQHGPGDPAGEPRRYRHRHSSDLRHRHEHA